MTRRLLSTVLLSTLPACTERQPALDVVADSVLRAELLERGRVDQAVRRPVMEKLQRGEQPDSSDLATLLSTDSANTRWLKNVIHLRGWPTKTRVGPEAVDAAFLIVQHATHDTAFQREMLPVIREAFETGEVDGQSVALLTDRVAVQAGRPQIYGTQATIVDGKVILHPIRDSALVDERRARMGLPALADYVALLDSMYTSRGKRP